MFHSNFWEGKFLGGDISNPTKSEECTDFDCVFHGTATGKRRADGSCECVCDTGYTGPQCRSIVGLDGMGWHHGLGPLQI